MMKNNKGYTILESVIAMLLVAIIVGGIFSSLMAARRSIMEPSYREDMMYAVESASNVLKNFVDNQEAASLADIKEEMCQAGSLNLLSDGEHQINCRLPYICDTSDSSFSYTVSTQEIDVTTSSDGVTLPKAEVKKIVFDITCNREKL